MLSHEVLDKRCELLDEVEHACLQMVHMNMAEQWKFMNSLRLSRIQPFDFRTLLKKTSEG